MPGSVGILNVGAGDTKLVFDPSKPGETERSATIVKGMIRQGFVLLVQVGENDKGPIYQRALDFDEATTEYIVAGMASDATPTKEATTNDQEPASTSPRGRKAAATRTSRRIPADSTGAVAVARTAGG